MRAKPGSKFAGEDARAPVYELFIARSKQSGLGNALHYFHEGIQFLILFLIL